MLEVWFKEFGKDTFYKHFHLICYKVNVYSNWNLLIGVWDGLVQISNTQKWGKLASLDNL